MASPPDKIAADDSSLPPSPLRTTITLLLFIHLFFVVLCLSANMSASSLQLRLLDVFAFYCRLLNLDLNFTPYHLTQATIDDVDHRIEILPEGKDAEDADNWLVLPDVGVPGGDRYQRYQRLAKVMAMFAEEEGVSGRFAQNVAAHFLHQRDLRSSQVRCRRHLLQDWNVVTDGTPAQRDPNDPSYFRVAYDASILIGERGSIDVLKISAAAEVARPDAVEEP